MPGRLQNIQVEDTIFQPVLIRAGSPRVFSWSIGQHILRQLEYSFGGDIELILDVFLICEYNQLITQRMRKCLTNQEHQICPQHFPTATHVCLVCLSNQYLQCRSERCLRFRECMPHPCRLSTICTGIWCTLVGFLSGGVRDERSFERRSHL